MIYNLENTVNLGKRAQVRDAKGQPIDGVVSYNSKTSEVVILVPIARNTGQKKGTIVVAQGSDGSVILAKGFAPGSSIWIDGVKQ